MKQQLANSHLIDTKVTNPLKHKGQAITELANKHVVDDQQKARPTMKPPNVVRK
jgi:hypothetical protein